MSHLQSAFAGTARFEILRHLGSGGMGSVYEAFDRQSGARIALKTIEHASGSALYQLKQEFRSLADIRHPNLVQLLELISDDERWFFTMELIDGVDFLSYVCSRWINAGEFDRRVPDLKRLRSSVIQLARGVDALHRAGKVHRDIKPPNVLVTPSGRVFVLDFGLVEDLSGPRADAASIQGTISYMSPEQAGQQPAVPASDWYAVGVMVYEALTGRLPFEGSPVEILAKKLMATPKAPVDLEPSVASEWNELCLALLANDPLHRPDSVEIYHDRIRQAVYAERGFEAEALHAKLARALEAEPRTRAGRLVRHWIGASRPERARTHVRAAIEEARAKLAFGQAVQLYRSALEFETAPAARPALFKGLGDSLANVGRPHAAAEAYLLGVTGADRATRLELQNLAAGKLLQGGYITEGVEALRGVLGLVGIKLAAAPAMVLASLVYQQLRLRLGGLEFRERAVSEIDREELLRLDVLRSASTGFSFVDTIRGADFQVRVLRQALRTGEIGRISEALALHGSYSAGQGGRHLQKGREAVERSFAMAERIGDPRLLAIASGGRGMIAFWAGNWDGTVAHFASGEQRLMNECHGVHWELATTRMFLGLGLMRLGEMRRLGDRYDVHVAHASMMGDQFGAASLKTRHNVVWLARDKPARAASELQGALSTWPPGAFHLQHFWALFATCERLLYEGDPEEAQRVMSQGVRPLKRSLLTRIQMVRAEATELQGRIALALAAAAAADQRSRDAMTARARRFGRSLSREGPGFTTAWGALILAGADFLAGDESPEVLDAAIEGLTEARCHLYAAAARRRRGELTEGEPGRALVAQADSWMIEKGIVHPARMTGMLTPAYRGLRGRMG